jgi:hypothetical protein
MPVLAIIVVLAAVSAVPQPTAAQPGALCFPDAPQITNCIEGRFREFWEQNGGLEVFGYPKSPAQNEVNRDTGQSYLTQWFERVRLEHHPENAAPYDVLLGRLGDDRLLQMGVDWRTRERETEQKPDCIWFEQTGHNLCNVPGSADFLAFWSSHGLTNPSLSSFEQSLALFGMPISDVQSETTGEAGRVLTQWFERARFEWHVQGEGLQGEVLLGHLGDEVRQEMGTAP